MGGLLVGVGGGGADDLLGHILGDDEQNREDEVCRGIVPADGRRAVLQREQPAAASLRGRETRLHQCQCQAELQWSLSQG